MEKAISDFKEATKLDAENSGAWLSLYEALLNSQRVEKVVEGERHNT